jgi:hypothetical protein
MLANLLHPSKQLFPETVVNSANDTDVKLAHPAKQ